MFLRVGPERARGKCRCFRPRSRCAPLAVSQSQYRFSGKTLSFSIFSKNSVWAYRDSTESDWRANSTGLKGCVCAARATSARWGKFVYILEKINQIEPAQSIFKQKFRLKPGSIWLDGFSVIMIKIKITRSWTGQQRSGTVSCVVCI